MIKIVLPDYPDRFGGKDIKAIEEVISIPEGVRPPRLNTEITHNGEKGDRLTVKCWDIDVYAGEGPWTVRVPAFSRSVTTRDMLYELMLASNGDADHWVRTLLGDADAEGLWDRYHAEHPS